MTRKFETLRHEAIEEMVEYFVRFGFTIDKRIIKRAAARSFDYSVAFAKLHIASVPFMQEGDTKIQRQMRSEFRIWLANFFTTSGVDRNLAKQIADKLMERVK
jgi:hypothetical protein